MEIVELSFVSSILFSIHKTLGLRFAYLQLKAALAEVIKNFEITVNSKTNEPIVFEPTNILLVNTGGVWLNFKPL